MAAIFIYKYIILKNFFKESHLKKKLNIQLSINFLHVLISDLVVVNIRPPTFNVTHSELLQVHFVVVPSVGVLECLLQSFLGLMEENDLGRITAACGLDGP